jgi:putative ABC transport system permease protein
MIELANVYKVYNLNKNNECTALKNINLNLPSNGLIFITGKSGCGKTTLLNIISGIDTPTKGEVKTTYKIKDYSAIIFQDFALIDYLSVYDNLMLVAKMNNKGSLEVLDIAQKYGIDNILNHLPNEISGGQKQRVSIARAIILDRPVLICDEPTGNLDSENTKIVCEILKNESKNRLVIVVSHDLEEFRSISDRIIKISDGIITSDEVINKIDDEINIKENKIIFGIKEKIYLVTKFFKKNIVKHIFTMITLFLSFLILLTSLNILLNSKAKVIYEAYKDDEVIDFSRYENVMDSAVPLSKEELEKYSKNSEAIFYDHKMYVDDITIERIYVASNTKRKMLYGENTIEDNEILISDYIATKLSDNIETLVGTTFNNYTIKGIYKTNYNKIVDLKDEYDTTCFNSIYMTENTFKYKNIDNTVGWYVYTKLKIDDNRKTSVVYQEEMTDSFTSVLYGEKTELKDNEIAIDLKTAQQYSDNPIELLGKTIELKFVNILDALDTKESKEEEGVFKCVVKYIFKDRIITDYNDIIVSRSLFKDIYGNYRASFSHNANGISLYNPSINKIDSMLKNDLDDYTYKADKISLGLSWIKPFSYIGLGLGVIMLIISIILMVNLVHIIFEKDKRTQGVLISFGVSKKEVARMYMLDILINVFLSFIISLVLEIFALMGFNKVLHTYINKESSIYYSFSSLGIILITIIFLMLIIYRRVLKKILKKQIVDIIYER